MYEHKINKKNEFSSISNALFIIATPIGNLEDITLRALDTLKKVNVILCEDTRVTQKLLSAYQINTKCFQFDDHASDNKIEKCLTLIEQGQSIALVSDAGTPVLSDPGCKLVNKAMERGIKVESLPGACSLINALVLSGFKSLKFSFLGFLPHEKAAKEKTLAGYKKFETTLIFFESPRRLLDTLKAASQIFPTSQVCVAREMTKRFEEITRGNFTSLINHYALKDEIRGEIVVLIETEADKAIDEQHIKDLLKSLLQQKTSLKDAVAEISNSYGVTKNKVYDLALSVRNEL
ncbi:16S rRNA (cytidine(1402)-2'-O)-methyltransferase [Holosporaceae bacterium 'Namur']|nr:16S rRNA (cytidine(1402)-2'-O)-methyltransferase [Holosporaceae bacterium 'Namur']